MYYYHTIVIKMLDIAFIMILELICIFYTYFAMTHRVLDLCMIIHLDSSDIIG